MATLNFSPYLPDGCSERLRAYVYKAEDRSLIYQHFWRPLCRASVARLPVWLAPNVITVTALLLVCLVHIGFVFWMPNVTLEPAASDLATDLSRDAQAQIIKNGVPFGSTEFKRFENTVNATCVPPTWLFVAGGAFLIVYQYLDNMDGHQARRTGTSSPLGLLMDHGCDAVNVVVGTLSVASTVCLGPTWKTWSVVSSGVIVFFCNTWEEYYRGALILPVVNGPNEGILMAAAVYFMTAWVGPAFWLQTVSVPVAVIPVWLLNTLSTTTIVMENSERTLLSLMRVDETHVGCMLNSLLTVLLIASSVPTVLGNFYQVAVAVRHGDGHGKYGSGWLLRTFPYVHALTRLLPLAVMTAFAAGWMYTSPANIFQSHPRIACWTFGLLYTKLAVHLMIAHLCSVEFHPLRRTLIPFLYCGAHTLAALYTRYGSLSFLWGGAGLEESSARPIAVGGTPFWGDELTLLLEFFVLSAVTFAHLAVNIVVEMAKELNVPVFTVPLDKQRATLKAIELERAAAKKRQ